VGEIEREVRIEASPETVYSLLTDAGEITKWMGVEAELDPRPGGVYRLRVNPQALALGEFVELDPLKRVVYTFGWDGHPTVGAGSTTVELTLMQDGSGTVLKLVHRDLPGDEVEQHTQGWEHFLSRLEVVGAGGDPGPDPMASAGGG